MELFKEKRDQTITVAVRRNKGNIKLDFSADSGKYGHAEIIAKYECTVEELLLIIKRGWIEQ